MRIFLYLLALLTGLGVADANPSARAAPLAVDSVIVSARNAASPVRAHVTAGCLVASAKAERVAALLVPNGAAPVALPVMRETPVSRCERLIE
jgi:hypothetical protein